MKVSSLCSLSLACLFAFGACAPRKPEPEERKPQPKTYTYTRRDKIVDVKEIPFKQAPHTAADFDGDGKKDMAVIQRTENGTEVVVYINKSVGRYYVAGQIARAVEGEIRGIAVKEGPEYVDLVLAVNNKDGSVQTIHFHNDGRTFREVPPPDSGITKLDDS